MTFLCNFFSDLLILFIETSTTVQLACHSFSLLILLCALMKRTSLFHRTSPFELDFLIHLFDYEVSLFTAHLAILFFYSQFHVASFLLLSLLLLPFCFLFFLLRERDVMPREMLSDIKMFSLLFFPFYFITFINILSPSHLLPIYAVNIVWRKVFSEVRIKERKR